MQVEAALKSMEKYSAVKVQTLHSERNFLHVCHSVLLVGIRHAGVQANHRITKHSCKKVLIVLMFTLCRRDFSYPTIGTPSKDCYEDGKVGNLLMLLICSLP